ncbi:MAG: septal ring lytic transglycosylase RlpA family lipoprotein [Methylotenera sp.]|nr:MAG: septal ring lytic transglycosylase RlpA family lipoprotein [Methylotenera sp.]
MIKQNHFNVAAVTTLFVVLLGCGNAASAKETPHNKGSGRVSTVLYTSNHKEQRNIRVKDKKSVISKKIVGKHSKQLITKAEGYTAVGMASWYGYESGNKTATGKHFNPLGLTAAHRTLPLNTKVKITNLKNNKSVILLVNDRGPYAKGRLIDLSLGSARAIGVTGVSKVRVETIIN